MFGAPHFPNSAFVETGPRAQCAAGFPHWKFSSVSALCRLQGAGPDLLPMVVLAGSWIRRSQITQYYNRLIGERFILIYTNFYCVTFASPGTALHCWGLVLASGLFCSFFSELFRVRRCVSPSRANTSACAFAPHEHVFFCTGSQPFRAFLFFLRKTFGL